jgi:phospholipid transport system transporter-binding protein
MTDATLVASGAGRWMIQGTLDFSTVPAVWHELEKLVKTGGELTVSLGGVTQTNSAGLVMLVEARDQARRSGCRLNLVELPSELMALARMSRCDALLNRNAA